MIGVQIKFEGDIFEGEIGKEILSQALNDAAEEITEGFRLISPIRTGRFKANWRYTFDPSANRFRVINSVPYSPYVEARFNIIKNNEQKALEIIVKHIQNKLRSLNQP
jgi:hypothetical protein